MTRLVARSALLAVTSTVLALAVPLQAAHADSSTLPTHTNTATGTAAKINELKLAGGYLYYEDDSATTTITAPVRTLFLRPVSHAGGIVSVGAEVKVATGVGTFLAASGDRYAYSNAADNTLYVKGPGARTMTLNPLTTTDVKLSGSRLLISTTSGDRYVDLVTGATGALPADSNLNGRYAVWFNADGSVDRRDLGTGATIRVRPAGGPTSCSLATPPCTVANSKTSAKVWGSYVLWRFDNETGWVNTAAGLTRNYLPTSKGTSLGNGVAVGKTTTVPSDLVQQDLTVSPVTTTTLASNVKKYTYDDRLAAWSNATTNAITLASLVPPQVTGSGRLLTFGATPAFSPNGDGSLDAFNGEWDFAKAVGSWTFSVTDSTGTVYSTTSTAPSSTGVVRTTWGGSSLADGVYSWHLSGQAADGDGVLVGDDGASNGLSGTVTISRKAPGVAGVSVPGLSTTLAPKGIVASWSTTTAPPSGVANRFDVLVAANRATTYTTWLSNTSLAKATYFGVPGNTYRLKVRVHDTAGNVGPWTVSAPSILPFDDRSTSIVYRGTWYAASSSTAYLGTERYSGLKGAYASYTGNMAGLRVIAMKCASCGKLTVVVDGHELATVDTYYSTTRVRQLVYARNFTTLGKHTVVLKVVGTVTRPRVFLDGLGTLR